MMKLLGSTEKKIKIIKLVKAFTDSVLVYCNIVKNDFKHNSRGLHIFVPNKLFGHLSDISSKNFF